MKSEKTLERHSAYCSTDISEKDINKIQVFLMTLRKEIFVSMSEEGKSLPKTSLSILLVVLFVLFDIFFTRLSFFSLSEISEAG